jgi:hypothetical protein
LNCQIIYIFIISSCTKINNNELQLYLRLDRRYKFKSDVRVNTSQREQYWGTVHLFMGTGRSPDKITFVSLITNHNQNTNHQGLNSLLLLSRCGPSSQGVVMPKLPEL